MERPGTTCRSESTEKNLWPSKEAPKERIPLSRTAKHTLNFYDTQRRSKMLEIGTGYKLKLVAWLFGLLSPETKARLTGHVAVPRVKFIKPPRGLYNNYLVRNLLDKTGGKHGCFLRVSVGNEGPVRIQGGYLQLKAVETRTADDWHIMKVNPANFHWANTRKDAPLDIPPKSEDMFCDIAHTVEGQPALTLFLNEEFANVGIPSHLQA